MSSVLAPGEHLEALLSELLDFPEFGSFDGSKTLEDLGMNESQYGTLRSRFTADWPPTVEMFPRWERAREMTLAAVLEWATANWMGAVHQAKENDW